MTSCRRRLCFVCRPPAALTTHGVSPAAFRWDLVRLISRHTRITLTQVVSRCSEYSRFYYFAAAEGVRSTVMSTAICPSVCLSVCSHNSKTARPTNYFVRVAFGRNSVSLTASRYRAYYVFPVEWITSSFGTSCVLLSGRTRRA